MSARGDHFKCGTCGDEFEARDVEEAAELYDLYNYQGDGHPFVDADQVSDS